MIPPVEEAILRNNPDFATLYTTLTTVVLNPDGSTKADPGSKERAAVKEVFHETTGRFVFVRRMRLTLNRMPKRPDYERPRTTCWCRPFPALRRLHLQQK